MIYQIQQKLGFGYGRTRALVIGDHGQNMIPYPEISAVGGVPLNQIIGQSDMEDIKQKTKDGGAEIVGHLKTSGYYAPGRSIAVMVEAILDDARIVMPSSVVLDGEYGYKHVTLGVPVVLGAKGVEKIIELHLDDDMKAKLDVSMNSIKEGIDILRDEGFFS
jgi:malate dehydrogenase